MFKAVGSVTGGGEKGFHRLVNIVRVAGEKIVVSLKIRVGDVGVGGVKVIPDGAGGGEAVSDVLLSEVADEHFVNSRQENVLESLVGAIVLVEQCGSGVKSIAKFGGLGASGIGRDDGFRSGIDRHDEGDGRKSVVDGG